MGARLIVEGGGVRAALNVPTRLGDAADAGEPLTINGHTYKAAKPKKAAASDDKDEASSE